MSHGPTFARPPAERHGAEHGGAAGEAPRGH